MTLVAVAPSSSPSCCSPPASPGCWPACSACLPARGGPCPQPGDPQRLRVLPIGLALPPGFELSAVVVVLQSLVELLGMAAFLWWVPRRLFPVP